MVTREPAAHLAEALLRAEASRKTLSPAPAPAAHFTIALSREVGARGTSVARELGARLHWPVFDHELLEEIARDLKVGVHDLTRLDERPEPWLLECMEALTSKAVVSDAAYFHRLLRMLLALSGRGECIIVGRGAAQLLPVERTLRVRLHAQLKDRVAVMSRELGVSAAAAAEAIARTDRERAEFIRSHFLRDPADAANYDLVLSTSRFTVSECADLILQALRRLEARAESQARG